MDRARAQGRSLVENGLASQAEMDSAFELVTASPDFDGSVDLVIESAPESMELKQDLFARLDHETRPDTVLTSNTSGMSITAIASKCSRPERVVTTHFWNPPHLMPLVEIVKGERTSDEVVERVRELLAACGKTPVVVKKDRPGQLGNRLQMALVREAVSIVQEGIADAEAVDLVAKNGFGIRLPAYGIFEHQDIVGLDLGLAVLEYVVKDINNEPRAPELMRELVREGKLGAKTGRGFYDWSAKSADGVRARRDAFLVEVLRYRRKQRQD
jgi:3-hydroxyacyl-CoA dehydrogenase